MLRGVARSQMSHYVNGIGRYQKDSARRTRQHPWHHVGKDGRIPLQQLETVLTRPHRHPSRQDDDAAIGQIRVFPCPDLKRMRKRHGVKDVVRFGLRPHRIQIHHHYLAAYTAQNHGIGCGRSDHTCTHNSDFHSYLGE
jgi:hypothetical protein